MTEILRTINLSKKYGREYANENISIHVKAGSVYGLMGKNGAGKTTLMKQIAGFTYSTSGRIEWERNPKGAMPKIGAAIAPDKLDKSLTAEETLRLYGGAYGKVNTGEAEELLKLFDLYSCRRKKIGAYSAGMRQKLAVALALMGDPDLVLLDEPINGLDPAGVKKLREILKERNEKKRTTIMISSHILGELIKIADFYGILANGKLVREFEASELEHLSMEEKENYFIRCMEGSV